MPKKINKDESAVNTTAAVAYQIMPVPEDMVPPAFFPNKATGDIEPYANVDGKYIPYDEAQVIFLERKIEALKKQLEALKAKLK